LEHAGERNSGISSAGGHEGVPAAEKGGANAAQTAQKKHNLLAFLITQVIPLFFLCGVNPLGLSLLSPSSIRKNVPLQNN